MQNMEEELDKGEDRLMTNRLSIVDEVTCPHRIRKPDSIDCCSIVNTPCLREEGLECDEWDEIRQEWEDEDDRR